MKPNSTWYENSQRIRILVMYVISGHDFVTQVIVPYERHLFREMVQHEHETILISLLCAYDVKLSSAIMETSWNLKSGIKLYPSVGQVICAEGFLRRVRRWTLNNGKK